MSFFGVFNRPDRSVELTYASVFIGFFITGIYPIFLEVAVEVTYPIPEEISSGVLLLGPNLLALLFILLGNELLEDHGGFYPWSNVILGFVSLLLSGIFCLRKPVYRRLENGKDINEGKFFL